MKTVPVKEEDLQWVCMACGRNLVVGPVSVTYMGSRFSTQLPTCPGCKWVLVTDEVALGKMAEAEQLLEDK